MSLGCEEVRGLLGREPRLPEAWAHVEGCADCRARLEAGSGRAAPSTSDAVLARIRARALEELRRQPKAPPWWREVLVLVGLCLVMGGFGAVMMEPVRLFQPPPRSVGTLLGVLGLIVLTMGVGAVVALIPRGRRLRPVALGLALLTALAVGLGGHGLWDGRLFALTGLGCLSGVLVVSLPPLALSLWMLLRVAASPLRTLAAGLCAGTAGLLALHLYCPIDTSGHLFTFHVLPWLALAALAVPLRQRLPSRSFAP